MVGIASSVWYFCCDLLSKGNIKKKKRKTNIGKIDEIHMLHCKSVSP